MIIDRATRRSRRLRLLSLAAAAGVTPTMGGIARACGVATSTVTGAIDGRTRPAEDTRRRLADGFGVALSVVDALLGGAP